MDNFLFSLNATLPVFLIILLGWALMQLGLFNREFLKVIDKYVFKVALPLLLFHDIATTDIRSVFDGRFVLFCMLATTAMFFGTWLFSWLFLKDKSMVGAFAQASARGSAAILGIAFVQNIYGDSGMAPLMIVSAVPLYNIYSVIILTVSAAAVHPQASAQKKSSLFRATLFNILKNPIILGIFAGLPFSLAGITIPAIPLKAVTNVAATATPMALLSIGAGFEGRKAITRLKPTIAASFLKLIGIPALFFPIACLLGFTGSKMVAILVMLGSPTTVSCYIMAKNMDNDEVLTSSIVVLTTLLSSVTLTGWIFFLRSMGLI